MAERLLASDAAEIVGVITGAAKAGDVGACRALLAYIVAPVREAPLPAINLPPCDDAAGVSECQSAIFAAAAAGRLTATEAQALSSLLEARRRSLETVELEARLRALEKGSPR